MKNITIILGLLIILTNSLFAFSDTKIDSPEEIQFRESLQNYLIKDGIEIPLEGRIIGPIIYSPDGKSFAYMTSSGDGKKRILIKDGIEIGKYDDIQQPLYSPDGKSFAYLVTENNNYFLIRDGIKTKIPSIMAWHRYSVDNKHGLVVRSDGKYILMEDGIVGDQLFDTFESAENSPNAKKYNFDNLKTKSTLELGVSSEDKIIYSPDGKSSAYTVRENGKQFLIKDGIKSKGYNAIHRFLYSPDGNIFIFSAFDGKESVLNINGVESKFTIQNVFHSAIGSSHCIIGTAETFGNKIIIKDGIKIGEYFAILHPQYSSDGKRFSFLARLNQDGLYTKYIAVIDGIESQEYTYIEEIIFSPDGSGYSFFATKPGISKPGISKSEISNSKSTFYDIFFSKNKLYIYIILGFVIGTVLLIYFYIRKQRISKVSTTSVDISNDDC